MQKSGRKPHPDERTDLVLDVPPKPHAGKRPFAGKAPMKHHLAAGKVVKKRVKRPRETADVALEHVYKKREELSKAEKRAGNAVSKDFFIKCWKTDTWTKTFKDMVDRMIRTLRDRINQSTRVMTKSRLDLVRFNMLPLGEDRSLFHFDLQRGQNNKSMNTLETISIVATLEYSQPLPQGVEQGSGQLASPISYDGMHVKVHLCCGENNAERHDYDSDEAFRKLVYFVRACTSKRVKDGKAQYDQEEDFSDADDAAEDTIASFSPDQRQFFMNKFLSFAVDYVCGLARYMDSMMRPANQYVDTELVYQYAMLAMYTNNKKDK